MIKPTIGKVKTCCFTVYNGEKIIADNQISLLDILIDRLKHDYNAFYIQLIERAYKISTSVGKTEENNRAFWAALSDSDKSTYIRHVLKQYIYYGTI